jgi:hypothetical protein
MIAFKRGVGSKAALDVGIVVKIREWLKSVGIENYAINDDFSIDVFRFVNLAFKGINGLPSYIQFNKIKGDFDIDDIGLDSLRGCPRYVDGYFSCQMNNLTNLIGGPEIVGRSYYANANNLISVEGLARKIGGNLDLVDNSVVFKKNDIKKISKIMGYTYV